MAGVLLQTGELPNPMLVNTPFPNKPSGTAVPESMDIGHCQVFEVARSLR